MSGRFPSTLWTQLIEVVQRAPVDSAQRKAALGALYARYRIPVLHHIQRLFRRSFPHASAEDLINAFFVHLLENDGLAGVSRSKGSFRAWVKQSAENFCRNQHDWEAAQKRGAAVTIALESKHDASLEDVVLGEAGRIFDRGYASSLYALALDELFSEYCARGQGALFNDLRAYILDDHAEDYQQLAQRHGLQYATIASAVNRLRRRFGMKLKHKLAESMADPSVADLEAEVRYLVWLMRDTPAAHTT